jgi:hypothetical protein
MAGFPGRFDARVAKRGGIVVSLPVFSIGYGVTEDVTIGALLVPTTIPGAMLDLRYRMYSSGRMESVLDVKGGGSKSDDRTHWLATASSNTSYRLSSSGEITAGVFVLGLRIEDRAEDETGTRRVLGVSASYDQFVTSWLGGQVTAVAMPVHEGTAEVSLNKVVVTGGADFADSTFVRGLVLIKPGKTWLITVGAIAVVTLDDSTAWFSIAKQW